MRTIKCRQFLVPIIVTTTLQFYTSVKQPNLNVQHKTSFMYESPLRERGSDRAVYLSEYVGDLDSLARQFPDARSRLTATAG